MSITAEAHAAFKRTDGNPEWEDRGTPDDAVVLLIFAVLTATPNLTVAECAESVTAIRNTPCDGLSDALLAARARLDLRMQRPQDIEKKRTPASVAEMDRRGGKRAAIDIHADLVGTLRAALREALDRWASLYEDGRTSGEPVELPRIAELRKLLAP